MIEIKNLSFSYTEKEVFNGLNLKINDNEFFSIIGPSGCGKSTLLYLIGGHLMPTSGRIDFDKHIILHGNNRQIITVFQDDYLFPHLNVYNNINLALSFRIKNEKERKEIIENYSNIFGIYKLLNRKIDEISGGERQRCAIVRALVLKPKILLLDEPLSSLDVNLRSSLRRILKKIQKDTKSTFIYVTHNQEEAFSMSDRVAVFNNDGKLQQLDKPSVIYNRPKNKFVADFIGMDNLFEIKKIVPNNDKYNFYIGEKFYFTFSRIMKNIKFIGIHSSDVIINDNNINYKNFISATIEDIEFHGPYTIISLKINDEINIYSRIFNKKKYKVGQKVKLNINEEGLVFILD